VNGAPDSSLRERNVQQSNVAASSSARARWSSLLRIAFEFALMFGIAIIARQVLVAANPGTYPNPLWLPVIVLSLQHGLGAGLAAALLAAGVQYWGGLPPALMTEDMYGYVGRIVAEPVGWTCVALLIGHIRSQQIAQNRELEAELIERNEHSAAVADLCADLRSRAEMLERQIAANAQSSNVDVAEAITDLQHATWEDFADRLTRFVILMTGAAEFSVYLRRDGALKLAFQPTDEHRPVAETVVPPDDPLFAAIVNERLTLSAAHPFDHGLLGERGIMAGPLIDPNASEGVIGMFAIGGATLDDAPEDIERRFALTSSEIARLADRISLIDSWEEAAAPSRSNGHGSKPASQIEPAPASKAHSTGARNAANRPRLPDNELTAR
jgi:polysaccharide biosynthesis protein PelD